MTPLQRLESDIYFAARREYLQGCQESPFRFVEDYLMIDWSGDAERMPQRTLNRMVRAAQEARDMARTTHKIIQAQAREAGAKLARRRRAALIAAFKTLPKAEQTELAVRVLDLPAAEQVSELLRLRPDLASFFNGLN
jgi:hypothetical protein